MEDIIEILITLKQKGAVGVKTSFEDEGALFNEVITIRNITSKVGLELALKIGGCEAKRDIVDATQLCVDSIVAPMIESGFAIKKFASSVKKYIKKDTTTTGINIETITSYNSIEEIQQNFGEIDFITFGRVDFIGSYNKERTFVESIEMRNIIEHVFTIAKKQNKKCYLGGAMSIWSFDIVSYLKDKLLLDKIETRYIIFDVNKILSPLISIVSAHTPLSKFSLSSLKTINLYKFISIFSFYCGNTFFLV
jgi:hypothetical protein